MLLSLLFHKRDSHNVASVIMSSENQINASKKQLYPKVDDGTATLNLKQDLQNSLKPPWFTHPSGISGRALRKVTSRRDIKVTNN